MPIYNGNKKIDSLYFNGKKIASAFFGSKQVYNASSGGLPADYQAVEYIETNGSQYIDTNFFPKPNTKVKTKIKAKIDNNKDLISCFDNSYFKRFRFFYVNSQGTIKCDFGNGSSEANLGNINIYGGSIYTIESYMGSDLQSFKVNGNENTTNYSYNTSSSYSLYLFARNNIGIVDNMYSTILYNCEIYDNEILVRDFVPCYRKADNKPGLYDLVNDVFYTNAGTGEFIVGGNV